MAEERANRVALYAHTTPQKPAPQNAGEATAAVSLRCKAAVPCDTLAYDVASAADAGSGRFHPAVDAAARARHAEARRCGQQRAMTAWTWRRWWQQRIASCRSVSRLAGASARRR